MALTRSFKDLFRGWTPRRRRPDKWPFIAGKYYVLDDTAPVIVVMPDNEALARDLAALSVEGLCMVSPVCRNVTDAEKLAINVEANIAIHCIILAGGKPGKAYPALEAMKALFSDNAEVSDKAAALAHELRGRLKKLDFGALQRRLKVVDMRGCVEVDKIIAGVRKHGARGLRPDAGFVVQGHDTTLGVQRVIAPPGIAHELKPDKAGSFLIGTKSKTIVVEHHNAKGELVRLIEGASARDIYITLIRNGWVSRLDHAAYLGRELTLAEVAIQQGVPYEQTDPVTAGNEPPSPDRQQ